MVNITCVQLKKRGKERTMNPLNGGKEFLLHLEETRY